MRFARDMVCELPSLLPRSVTVAQVTLDHFVMVRIHARQPFDALKLAHGRPFAILPKPSMTFAQERVEWAGCAILVGILTVFKIGPVKRGDLTYLPTLEPPPAVSGHAFLYILVRSDGALYVGSAGDLAVRLRQHGG